ncbi:MAG TPA: NAD(P)(+) transhydrogenase (Re/Si-specific) subunit beta [Thermoanaerobaculia bacterium]|jgi:NAD(P) transhydrogenase subunit beta|nr:NAD(P)(+) transhydrogenase (Re/Si-specific) subunit beta [Thermoanaerobaculia bacterium]
MSSLFPYLIASVCFILALQGLSSPVHARRGNLIGAFGMLVAVVGTLIFTHILTFLWIAIGLMVGAAIGAAMSIWIPMTKMPERIALSHCFGGLAAALVGVSEYHHHMVTGGIERITMAALGLEVFLGFLTFTGSLMAFGKLQGLITGAPVTWKGQNASNITMFFAALVLLVLLVLDPTRSVLFFAMGALGLVVGVLAVLPIGGADMPVVISLLNSYAGLASASTGFALGNPVLIIAGALDGTSGFLLSMKMSKAMNRSFANVLFGAFGKVEPVAEGAAGPAANYNLASVEDAVGVLAAAQSLIVVPGYGMAVSQAQHAVRELAQALEANGTTVKYAIHPVAGRMPGHMNVLLAEANVPYDQLYDLDDINDEFARTDVALVVGANDVVNPAAKTNPGSPIYGMPVFNTDAARVVIVLKRSVNTGFAGIENDLFVQPNTMMVLGDAKKTLREFIAGVKEEAAA